MKNLITYRICLSCLASMNIFPPWLTQYRFDKWDFQFLLECYGLTFVWPLWVRLLRKGSVTLHLVAESSNSLSPQHKRKVNDLMNFLQGRNASFKRKWRREQEFCWGNAVCLKLGEKLPKEFVLLFLSVLLRRRCQKKTIRGSGFTKGQMFTVNVNESLYRSGSFWK